MEGPLNKGEEGLRVSDVQKDRIWDLHSISFELPSLLAHSIRAIPIRGLLRQGKSISAGFLARKVNLIQRMRTC